ncbi:MAG TPA: hypothetical protein VJN42_07730 [Candidatus Acidoferrum sp.]|nr:hypothetical protein [Candidatus Acidoferrum sp.]
MSRKLAVVLLATLVLTGAMALKTAVTMRSHGTVLVANGCSPLPILPPTHQASKPY